MDHVAGHPATDKDVQGIIGRLYTQTPVCGERVSPCRRKNSEAVEVRDFEDREFCLEECTGHLIPESRV